MKACAYCGKDNSDEALICFECGTDEFKGEKTETEPCPGPEYHFGTLSADEMKKDWVTLIKCRTLAEADLIVSRLDAADIPTFLPDEFVMQNTCWNLNTYGYVRIQVSPNRQSFRPPQQPGLSHSGFHSAKPATVSN